MSWFKDHLADILTGLGIVGLGATIYFTNKECPEAEQRLIDAQQSQDEDLTILEKTKIMLPAYKKTAASASLTVACMIASNRASAKQITALTAAYGTAIGAYSKYRSKIREIFGSTADDYTQEAIQNDVKYEELTDSPPWDEKQTFYLEIPGSKGIFFDRTMREVMEAEYHINRNFILRGYATYNEFLSLLNLDPIQNEYNLGWYDFEGEVYYGYRWIDFSHRYYTLDDGLRICSIDIPFSPHLQEEEEL